MRISAHRLLTHRGIVVATFAAALALFVLAFAAPGALAAPSDTPADRLTGVDVSSDRDEIVRAGGDVFIAAGRTVDSVTVFGGDAVIAGTVRHSVVTVGGDVVLRSTARVGTEMASTDATVFAIGGTARTAPGAVVTGTTGAWEDVRSGEALVAAAVAMAGIVIAGAVLATLAVGVIATTTLIGAAMLAGLVWLIVWLVRRDGNRTAGPAMAAPLGTGPVSTYDPTTGSYAAAPDPAGATAQTSAAGMGAAAAVPQPTA